MSYTKIIKSTPRSAFKYFSVWYFKLMFYYIEVHMLTHYIQRIYAQQRDTSPTCQSRYSDAETRINLPQIVSEGDRYLSWSLGLVFFCFNKLLVHGIPVPKHVAIDTCHELYFMICILLSAYLFHIYIYIYIYIYVCVCVCIYVWVASHTERNTRLLLS
jgi:hypothetical protein